MSDENKLSILYDRLAVEQKRLIDLAAAQDTVPPAGMLRHIADLESAITAVSTLIEDRRREPGADS